MTHKILVINPGSTSTKIAVFEDIKEIFVKNINHNTEDLSPFQRVSEQYDFRKRVVIDVLKSNGIELSSFSAVIGRGGLIKPVSSGVYIINDLMKKHLRQNFAGEHASNLGGLIADSIAKEIGLSEAYIADPVVVDELQEVARVTGHPKFKKKSVFHALNQKAIARVYAKEQNINYEELRLIVAHMGGGISVGAHKDGQVVDVNQALNGDGPFSPERSGTLPMDQIIGACFSGKYTKMEMLQCITGKGGYVAYFGHNNAIEIEKAAREGNPKASLIEYAMAYQVAKEIGACATVLKGRVDAILLTGGLAYGKPFVEHITRHVSWIAPVKIYPGEDEMRALALNALMVLEGTLKAKKYDV
jgi:butyrate kinase